MQEVKLALSALYYPYIYFRSAAWLKAALLYWEKLQRIVPDHDFALTDDSEEVRQLQKAGLIENLPAADYRTEVASAFTPRLGQLLESRQGRLFGTASTTAAAARNPQERHVHIDVMKIDGLLAQQLQDAKFAVREGNWYRMAEDVAGLYMITLAGRIAHDRNAPLVTEQFACDVASLYFNTAGGTLSDRGDGFALARLVCPFPGPERAAQLSVATLLEVRQKNKSERRIFRKHLQALASEMETINTPAALRDLVNDKKSEIESAIQDHKELVDELQVGTVWNAVKLSTPTLIPAAAAWAGFPPLSIAILGVGSLAIGGLNWFGERRGKDRQASQSPWQYLLSLDRSLPDRVDANDVNARMTELIYD